MGAEVARLALEDIMEALKDYKDAELVNFIHDSYIVECPDDPAIYEPIANAIAQAMQEAWKNVSSYTSIRDLPMPVKVHVGPNWGTIEKDTKEYIYD